MRYPDAQPATHPTGRADSILAVRSGLDLKRLGEHAWWFNADNQGRTGATPAWGAAQQGRVAQAVMKGRTITNVTGAWSTGNFVHEDDFSPDTLRKYSALILPNVAFLSDAQCRQLEAFARSGGSVLATFETGLYDERGRPRPDFGLGKLFGIQKNRRADGRPGLHELLILPHRSAARDRAELRGHELDSGL